MTLVSGITRDADEQPGVKFRSVVLLLLVRARSYVTVTAKRVRDGVRELYGLFCCVCTN